DNCRWDFPLERRGSVRVRAEGAEFRRVRVRVPDRRRLTTRSRWSVLKADATTGQRLDASPKSQNHAQAEPRRRVQMRPRTGAGPASTDGAFTMFRLRRDLEYQGNSLRVGSSRRRKTLKGTKAVKQTAL